MAPISESLLKILACPKCRHPVDLIADRLHCRNPACALSYPVRDGIPVMLIEEATRNPRPATPDNA